MGDSSDSSSAQLEKLGYKQDLDRTLSFFANFGIAFCYISPVVGVYSLFGYGLATAGPAFVWSIPIVAAGQFLVALVFAEVASAYPLAGALYQWGKRLVGQRYGWLVGWIYGWALLVTIAAVDYAGAPYVAQLAGLSPTPHMVLAIAVAMLVLHSVFNVIGVRAAAFITNLGVVGEVAATVVIAGVLIAAGLSQPASVLLTSAGAQGSDWYVPHFLAAMLSSVWVFYGFEAAGDVAEEVIDASRKVPRAMLTALASAVVVTSFLVVTLVLATPSFPEAMADPARTIAIIFEARLGKTMAGVTLALVVFAYLSCATAIQAACARLVFAYARDEMIPGSKVLKRISAKSRAPLAALSFTGVVALAVLFLTQLNVGDVNASAVIVSYAAVGIYVSFQMILAGYLWARAHGWRADGAFKLGRWAVLVAAGGLVYGVTMIVNLVWPRPSDTPVGWFPLVSSVFIVVSGLVVMATRRFGDGK